ncbi:MAG: hypothetical protein WAW92_04545 [Minisyncoccia bacterium]
MMQIKLKYEVGSKIHTENGAYKVIGFEYIKGRGMRYCLLAIGAVGKDWLYMYDFEIKAL